MRLTHSLKNSLVIFDPSELTTLKIFIISNKRLVKPVEEITERDSWGNIYYSLIFSSS